MRPILEDELRDRIAELEGEVEDLKTVVRETEDSHDELAESYATLEKENKRLIRIIENFQKAHKVISSILGNNKRYDGR